MAVLFVSDVHLSARRPDQLALFLRFLAFSQDDAEALYILGDLFDAWLGDDDQSALAQSVIDGLARFSSRGAPLYFIRGNRDFLMDSGFEKRTGGRILDDPTVIDLYGCPTLISHGDSLCTRDIEYQAFRRKLYSAEWKQSFLAQPYDVRVSIAKQIRQASFEASSKKAPEIMDVTPEAVVDLMRTHNVRRLIHGHTHRPNVHQFSVDGQNATRTVLGDWYEKDSVLVVTERRQTLMRVGDYMARERQPNSVAKAG
jgi:UDP-2,3-diacylglucosamine hydrolase